jgi:hypothetical protein
MLKQAIKFDKDPISAPLCPIYNDPEKQQSQSYKKPLSLTHTHTHTHTHQSPSSLHTAGNKTKSLSNSYIIALAHGVFRNFFLQDSVKYWASVVGSDDYKARVGGSTDYFYTDYNFQTNSLFCNLQTREEL